MTNSDILRLQLFASVFVERSRRVEYELAAARRAVEDSIALLSQGDAPVVVLPKLEQR